MNNIKLILKELKNVKKEFSFKVLLELVNFLTDFMIFAFAILGLSKYMGVAVKAEWWLIYLLIGLLALLRIGSFYLTGYVNNKLVNKFNENIKNNGLVNFYSKYLVQIFVVLISFIFVFVYVGLASSFILSIFVALSYASIALLIPYLTKKRIDLKKKEYLTEKESFDKYFKFDKVDEKELKEKNNYLDYLQRNLNRERSRTHAIIDFSIALFVFISLFVGILIYYKKLVNLPELIMGIVAIYTSFTPVARLGFMRLETYDISSVISNKK